MISGPRLRASRICVWVACAAGTVHAAFSLHWALGGRWLLATVGQWAVDRSAEAPLSATLTLGIVAAGKLLAAVTPVAVVYGKLQPQPFWRAAGWIGGALLMIYGGINVVLSGAVLAGVIRPDGGYNQAAMIGHTWIWDPLFFIWDPLFFIWGLALGLSLWLSRPARVRAA